MEGNSTSNPPKKKGKLNVFRVGVQCSGVVVLEAHFTVFSSSVEDSDRKAGFDIDFPDDDRWVASWWRPMTSSGPGEDDANFLLGHCEKFKCRFAVPKQSDAS